MPEKHICFCCKKEKEGKWVFFNERVNDKLVWLCNDCNSEVV